MLSLSTSTLAVTLVILLYMCNLPESKVHVNVRWSSDYTESVDNYYKYNSNSSIAAENYVTTGDQFNSAISYAPTEQFEAVKKGLSEDLLSIINLSEQQAWQYLSNGLFTEYPKDSYKSVANIVSSIKTENTETINVRCWYWEYPTDYTNFSKVTVYKTFAVNSAIAPLFRAVFEEIYEDPNKPIINISDAGMGTWVLRGKNHNSNNTLSSHSLGTAIDINPSTGSFNIDGVWYGNAYKHKAMTYSMWSNLPETHKKYHVLYVDSPIVSIFKKYGFYWGGDWTTGTDSMHLAFIGDGPTARSVGQKNSNNYR